MEHGSEERGRQHSGSQHERQRHCAARGSGASGGSGGGDGGDGGGGGSGGSGGSGERERERQQQARAPRRQRARNGAERSGGERRAWLDSEASRSARLEPHFSRFLSTLVMGTRRILLSLALSLAPQQQHGAFVQHALRDNTTVRYVSQVDLTTVPFEAEWTRRFSSANPELSVQFEWTFKETLKKDLAHHLGLLENGPSVVGWYAGGDVTRTLVKKGQLRGLGGLLRRSGLAEAIPASLLKGAVDEQGEPYVLPTDYYHWGVSYNKELLRELGIAVPRTMDEFLAACATFQAAGVLPITIGTKYKWPAAGWFDYLNMRLHGEFHTELTSGVVPMTDARVKAVFALWKQLLPFFPPPQRARELDWYDMAHLLSNKSAGFALIGDFVRQETANREQIDFFQFPILDPTVPVGEDAPCDGVVIPRNVDNAEAAERLVAWLGSVEYQTARLNLTSIPSNVHAAALISDDVVRRGAAMVARADFVSQFYDRDTTPAMAAKGMDVMIAFLERPDDIDKLLDQLEVDRQEIYLRIAAQPALEPAGGSFPEPVTVRLETRTAGATIYYTTDGSQPSEASVAYAPAEGVRVSESATLRAVAVLDGLSTSREAQATFHIGRVDAIGEEAARAGRAATAVSIAALLCCAAWVLLRRAEPVVKATSPTFVVLNIVGSAVLSAACIPMSVDVGQDGVTLDRVSAACVESLWLLALGFGLALGSLLVKTIRISALFEPTVWGTDSATQHVHMYRWKDRSLLRYVALITLAQAAVNVLWNAIDPPVASLRRVLGGNTQYYLCASESDAWAVAFAFTKAMTLIPAVAFAFLTRNVTSAFNESKTIAFAVYNFIAVGGLLLAISFLLADKSASTAYLMRVCGLLVTCLVNTAVIVAPKIYLVYMRPDLNTTKHIIDQLSFAASKNSSDSQPRPRSVLSLGSPHSQNGRASEPASRAESS